MKHMEDRELLASIETMERQAVGYFTSEIQKEQTRNLDYYLSKPFGTEEDGRSQVISSDVWDVIEGMTPIILEPFVSSEDVVRFNPVGADDEKSAQQESDYINWVVTQKNDSFNELHAAVKTGLLQKNAVAKYWWEKSRKATIERYFGLSDDMYALLVQDEDVEITEHNETQSPGPDGQPQLLHDVTIRVVDEVGEAKYQVLPPEEFLISRDARSPNPQLAKFCQHRQKVTISALREMGYDVDDDLPDGGDDPTYSELYQARRQEEQDTFGNNENLDPASREVLFKETYILIDKDGDGVAELRKICHVADKIFVDEETEEIPFVSWTPSQQAFKFYGRCPADETIEIQLVKSTLWRQSLDNIYTINNNRVYVSDKVNLDDLLDNQIAGVVRIPGTQGITNDVKQAEITPIGQVVQPMIEYLDSAKENRTGFTRYNQGSDSDSLNKTATGIRLIQQSASGRTGLIRRAFAEQFMAPLMRGVHGLCRRHATKAETIRLRGEWVPIDPREWKTRTDLTISVGLGTADQQMKMQGAQLLLQTQTGLMQAGIVQPQNLYNSATKLVESIGYKNPEEYFTAPDKMPPQPNQGPPPELQLQAKELDLKGMDHDLDRQKLELEKRKVDILDRDSMVKADVQEAQIALQAQAQGIDMLTQLTQAVAGIQQQLHSMQIGAAQHELQAQGQAHDQALQARQQEASEQDQMHSQALAGAQHDLQAQGQEHGQQMAEASQDLAAQQAAKPQV